MIDSAAVTSVIKDTFTPRQIQSICTSHKEWALWNLLDKRAAKLGGVFGRQFIVPFKTNDSQAVGSSISAAETKAATSAQGGEVEFKGFAISPTIYYGASKVDGVVNLEVDGRDQGSFIDALTEDTESVLATMGKRYAIYAHGNGSAVVGIISGSPTSTTIKVRAGDKRKLARGMDLVGVDPATGTVRSATSRRITKMGSDGTCTLSGSPVALGWVDGDWVAPVDDYGNVITGLAKYNPVVEPTTTTLVHGLDISTDYKFSGMRASVSAYPDALEALIGLASECGQEGAFPTHAIANPVVWQSLRSLLPDQNSFKSGMGEGSVGYETIKVRTPEGVFDLLSDPAADPTVVRTLNEKYLFWLYAGPSIIHPINEDGNLLRKISGQDAFGIQWRSIVALACDKPNSLGVLTGFTAA